MLHARLRQPFSIPSGTAGTNLRKPARYAGENREPLQQSTQSTQVLDCPQMAVSKEQLQEALMLIQRATQGFVDRGFFQSGVLVRLTQWIHFLPTDRKSLAVAIGQKAAEEKTGTGADVNGVALDEEQQPSLEALVLHYSKEEPGLFPSAFVAAARKKLASHGGPRYVGTWP
jgi:hypothetical protein